MIFRGATGRLLCKATLAFLAFAGFVAASDGVNAQAPVRLSAHYVISMTRVTVGEITWSTNFTESAYLAAATGKASGVLSVLVKGEGSLTTRGALADGKLVPAVARFDVSDEDGVYETEMTFEDGVYKKVVDRGTAPPADRIPVGPKLLRDVIDPLTAFLIPYAGNAIGAADCTKTLKIFDGRRRYNLALTYKRSENIEVVRGYSGPALVCGVVLHPLGGYRPDSLLVRYLAGKNDLELWLAPIAGVSVLAPVRALMPTLVGTMDISADEFVERKLPAVAPVKPVEAAPLAPVKP
jgi:hypothetical protein